MSGTEARLWRLPAARECVSVRDMDRSALSGVPKQSGPAGQYSHHHRQLRSRGGDDSPANLVLLTGTGTTGEHGWVHAHPGAATILGYMVPTGANPAEVPIWRLNAFNTAYAWHLQTDDGDLVTCEPCDRHPFEVIAAALEQFEQVRLQSRRHAFHAL